LKTAWATTAAEHYYPRHLLHRQKTLPNQIHGTQSFQTADHILPCETRDPGEEPDDDEEICPLGQIDDGFGNCIDEEGDPEPLDCMGVEGGKAYLDSCGNCVGGDIRVSIMFCLI